MTQRFGGTGMISLLISAVVIGMLWQFGVLGGGGGSNRAAQAEQQITQAENATGEANLTAITPAIAAFFADHGTYEGLGDPAQGLLHYDASATGLTVVSADSAAYCVQTAGTPVFSLRGPGGTATPGAC
jgi:hypothetical protein